MRKKIPWSHGNSTSDHFAHGFDSYKALEEKHAKIQMKSEKILKLTEESHDISFLFENNLHFL